jgi:hypothetical protein
MVFLQIRKPPHPGVLVALDLIAAGTNIALGIIPLVAITTYTSSYSDEAFFSEALSIAGSSLQVITG